MLCCRCGHTRARILVHLNLPLPSCLARLVAVHPSLTLPLREGLKGGWQRCSQTQQIHRRYEVDGRNRNQNQLSNVWGNKYHVGTQNEECGKPSIYCNNKQPSG